MRCIFCKKDSSTSKSREHIIPESLWNHEHVLLQGVVCDKCNNYFSREVEKPFLESATISLLRFEQAIPSKRHKVPPTSGLVLPNIPAVVTRAPHGEGGMSLTIPPEAIPQVFRAKKNTLVIPASADVLPEKVIVSRFLAKAAIEAMTYRIMNYPSGIDYIVDETQLDSIRDHARKGYPVRSWPVHVRRIYPADRAWRKDSGDYYQIAHEFDILKTDWDEWFFVLAIFGLELVINYGGPEIEGYTRWLSNNGDTSPLYSGKNAEW